jgi:hypothetical protein
VESSRKEHPCVHMRLRRLGDSLTTTDDAGNRCGMVGFAAGRSGNELVGKVEACQRMHCRQFKGVVQEQDQEAARVTRSASVVLPTPAGHGRA